jgi:hypothetical protein
MRIFCLHALLLGFVTLGLVNGIRDTWPEAGKQDHHYLAWAAAGLIFSLLLISGCGRRLCTGRGAWQPFSCSPWGHGLPL